LSCLESEHFDLVMVKLRQVPSLENEESWSVSSRSHSAGPACFWQAMPTGVVTWLWRTWEFWTN
jgi:hypothetical protein